MERDPHRNEASQGPDTHLLLVSNEPFKLELTLTLKNLANKHHGKINQALLF